MPQDEFDTKIVVDIMIERIEEQVGNVRQVHSHIRKWVDSGFVNASNKALYATMSPIIYDFVHKLHLCVGKINHISTLTDEVASIAHEQL